jgi:hypothetical protein
LMIRFFQMTSFDFFSLNDIFDFSLSMPSLIERLERLSLDQRPTK